MFDLKETQHLNELLTMQLDKLETALDDDCPDIQQEIESLIEQLWLSVKQ